MNHARRTNHLTAAAAIVALASLVGCQETVVRESYAPSTGISGSAHYIHANATPAAAPARAKQPGLIEGVGDFMFGWVDDVFAPKPKPAAQAPRNPKYDPIWVRMDKDAQ